MKRSLAVMAICFTTLLAGCGDTNNTPQSDLHTVTMKIGSEPFTLEVADNMATREHGLMERDSMPSLHGMLFVFDDETNRYFWMKNTRIPLDILFVDHDGKVVSTATMKPYDLGNTPSNAAAKYAIELNAGDIQKTGVKVGDQLQIPADAKDAKN